MSVLLCISATEAESARLVARGPRRDFVELAKRTGGEILFRDQSPGRGGFRHKLLGPHIKQAWNASHRASAGDVVFADGEHVGLPLAAFLGLRRKFDVRVVLLGHFLDRPWKLWPIRALSRFGPTATVAVHSVAQAEIVNSVLGSRWTLALVPYQVDTIFWRSDVCPVAGPPVLLAVGSEHRDYATLVEAVRGLPVRLRIAAGSHWARQVAALGKTNENIEYIDRALPFAELRGAYEEATAVVVPLIDVTNQSGVTTILEAMSMARPVITTANRGQRECVEGETIFAPGQTRHPDDRARGPHVFSGGPPSGHATGVYTPVADAQALRAAISKVVNDGDFARQLGEQGRASVCQHFTFESYVATLAKLLGREPAADGSRS